MPIFSSVNHDKAGLPWGPYKQYMTNYTVQPNAIDQYVRNKVQKGTYFYDKKLNLGKKTTKHKRFKRILI